MKIDDADWFPILLEEGSVTRTATRLHLTQQTLSARLAALERELGVRLVNRTSPLTLTRQGEEYVSYLSELGKLNESFHHRLDAISQGTGGVLRVGVTITRGKVMMARALPIFAQTHPTVRIEMREGANDALISALYEDAIDVCIARYPEVVPGIEVKKLHDEEMTLVVPPSYAIGLNAASRKLIAMGDLSPLGDCPYLMCVEGDISQRMGRALLDEQQHPARVALVSDSVDLLLGCCREGLGAVFCPDYLLPPDIVDSGCAVIKLGKRMRYSVGVGVLKAAETWRAKEDFVAALQG